MLINNLKKRIAAVGLGLLLSGLLLTGCGKGADEETAQIDSKTEGTSEEENGTDVWKKDTEEAIRETNMAANGVAVHVGAMKGPTSLGLLFLQEKSKSGEAMNEYEFSMVTAADELLPLMIKGELDIVLVPANVSSVLYQKMEGELSVIDINTLGVLYMVSGNGEISEIGDLKGKTIYNTGKGTTPDYVLRYILGENGIGEDDVVVEYKSEAAEVAALLAGNPQAVGLLPQPFVTAACIQNDALNVVFDLNEEWDKLQGDDGSSLVTGVTVVRKAFLEEYPEAVASFMREHQESAAAINDNPEKGAELAVAAGIVAKEPVAVKAIPECNITYIDGAAMKQALSGYLEVLYSQNPQSVGGKLPEDDFYYVP